MRSLNRLRVALLFPIATLLPDYALAAPKYVVTGISITELPMPSVPQIGLSRAYDINNLGDVVGEMEREDHAGTSPFIYTQGQTLSLFHPNDWLGDPEDYEIARAVARGINDSRVVVGYYEDQTGAGYPFPFRPFYYFPGIWLLPMISQPASSGLDWQSRAYAINNQNFIVGRSTAMGFIGPSPGFCIDRAATWDSYSASPEGLMCPPGIIHGQRLRQANDVNDSNDIVGIDAGETLHNMFLYKSAQMLAVPPPEGVPSMGSKGEPLKGVASGINNLGKVVGTFGFGLISQYHPGSPNFTSRAFIWDGISAESQPIPMMPNGLDSEAVEINDQNMVAGTARRNWPNLANNPNRNVAFIWHSNFGTVALPGLHTNFFGVPKDCSATAINNRRSSGLVQVVGTCTGYDGVPHAVRWDITTQVVVPLP